MQDIQATIRRYGDGHVINGRKGYCTGSLYAHWLAVLALDEEQKGQLAFVERGTPGLVIVDDWDSIGQRTTSSGTVLAEDLRVAAFNLFPTYRSYENPTLAGPFAQLTTAAIDAGIARAALRDTIAFVQPIRPAMDRCRCGKSQRRSADHHSGRGPRNSPGSRRSLAGTGRSCTGCRASGP